MRLVYDVHHQRCNPDGLSEETAVALERIGHEPVQLIARRAEHVHTDAMRARIRERIPDALVVLDIAEGRVAGVDQLVAMQKDVAAEVSRCSRTRPIFAGEYALLRFSSPAQVHPLVAVRWMHRLSSYIVIAANGGYIAGRVNFAVRAAQPIDLLSRLHAMGTDFGPEYGHGHARATGGSLSSVDFERWLERLGFGHRATGLEP